MNVELRGLLAQVGKTLGSPFESDLWHEITEYGEAQVRAANESDEGLFVSKALLLEAIRNLPETS